MRILLASIYPYAYFLLLLIIPFDEYVRVLPNVLFGIIVVAFPFVVKKSDFKKLKSFPALIFLVLLLYLVGNTVFLDRTIDNITVLSKILVAAGLLVLYLPIRDFNKVSSAIIYSSLVAIVISVANIIVVVPQTGTFDVWHPLDPLDALLIERLYMGLLCVLSIIMSVLHMGKAYKPENKYFLANIILNVAFVLLIVSRFAIITLIVLAILRLLYGEAKLLRAVTTVLLLGIVIFLAFLFNDNLKKRFLYFSPDNVQGQSLLKKTKQVEPRTIIWDCATTIAEQQDALTTGLGFDGAREAMVACYETIGDESKREKFLSKRYNTHNQFLDFLLSTGIVSVILFALFFVVLFLRNRKQFIPTALLITIVLFASIENFFHRQMGAYYFGIIIILLLLQTKKTNQKIEVAEEKKLEGY